VNSMICSWIINIVDPKLHTSVAYVETALVMWESLRKRYTTPNTPKIDQLKTNIAAAKHGGLEVVDFYSKLMSMWSELSNYIKIPQCTCRKCECEVGPKVVKMIEDEQTHQVLVSLDDVSYANIQSQVLALDPLPTLDKIFNMILQEEHHKQLMLGRDLRTVAFAVRHKSGGAERSTCKHCGRFGYDEASCYESIGYPSNWSTRGRGRGGQSGRGGCAGKAAGRRGRGAG